MRFGYAGNDVDWIAPNEQIVQVIRGRVHNCIIEVTETIVLRLLFCYIDLINLKKQQFNRCISYNKPEKLMVVRKALPSDIEQMIKLRCAYIEEEFGVQPDKKLLLLKKQLRTYFDAHLGTDLLSHSLV